MRQLPPKLLLCPVAMNAPLLVPVEVETDFKIL